MRIRVEDTGVAGRAVSGNSASPMSLAQFQHQPVEGVGDVLDLDFKEAFHLGGVGRGVFDKCFLNEDRILLVEPFRHVALERGEEHIGVFVVAGLPVR